MTTKTEVLDLVESYIDFRVTRVADRLQEIRAVNNPKLKTVYAKESLNELIGNSDEYNDSIRNKVGEAFAKMMKDCVKELDKIASGGTGDVGVLDALNQ